MLNWLMPFVRPRYTVPPASAIPIRTISRSCFEWRETLLFEPPDRFLLRIHDPFEYVEPLSMKVAYAWLESSGDVMALDTMLHAIVEHERKDVA